MNNDMQRKSADELTKIADDEQVPMDVREAAFEELGCRQEQTPKSSWGTLHTAYGHFGMPATSQMEN